MDPHRRFDAPAPPSTLDSVFGLLGRRWGVAIAWMIVVAIVGAAAVGLLFVDRLKTVAIEAGVASTSLFVVVDPKATAVEMDAIGPRIKATPGVADATPRPRDAALQALVANGLPPPEGRNPLPDIWVVRPSAEGVADGAVGFAARLGQVRTALAALPQVAAVRVDERWVGQLDGTIGDGVQAASLTRAIGSSTLVLLLGLVGWLGATAMNGDIERPLRKSVLALSAMVVSVTALLVDVAAVIVFSAMWKPNAGNVIEVTWQHFATTGGAPLAAAALAIVLISVAAALLARPSGR